MEMTEAFVLINTEVGAEDKVREKLLKMQYNGAKVDDVKSVNGVYDIVTKISAKNNETLIGALDRLREYEGIKQTTTCLVL